ncbi:hypothetical protein HAP94_17585 [Acidithiobacillus ferrivorans]|nr:hypothetical protein [Acidithiobacillus ferrivorans]
MGFSSLGHVSFAMGSRFNFPNVEKNVMLFFILFLLYLFPAYAMAGVVATTDSVDASAFESTLTAVFGEIAAVVILVAFGSLAIKWVISLTRRG